MLLRLDGHRDCANATLADIATAVGEMARPEGPTYIIVESEEGTYAQAAGSDGRYVVESRTSYGEGFQHFRVCHDLAGPDSDTVVHYRRRCSKHPPGRCPIRVRESEVCSLAEVERAILAFAATGERDAGLRWRDVTAEMAGKALQRPDGDDEISLITPQ